MIFFLVEYTCFDPQSADKVLDSLSKAAQYQIDNSITGVLTYHFSRPSMKEPEKLRFLEFYTSEKAFWEHSMEPIVSRELMGTYDPNIRKSFSWWALYSNEIGRRVKETVATLKGIEVSAVQKHVNLDFKSRPVLEPVLLVGKFSKEQNSLKVFLEQNEGPFSESAIYQFFFDDPMGDSYIISLWPSEESMISSLIQLELPEAELCSQIYLGKEGPTSRSRRIFVPWKTRFLSKPEAGYCLHPSYIE
jgi:quinol monooxygenase YgiN